MTDRTEQAPQPEAWPTSGSRRPHRPQGLRILTKSLALLEKSDIARITRKRLFCERGWEAESSSWDDIRGTYCRRMEKKSIVLVLTACYVLLLGATGWATFLREDYIASVDPDHYEAMHKTKLTAEETATFKAGLDQLTDNNQKRQGLAFQSFNVVLGAALGFLSALAASQFGKAGPQGATGPRGETGR